MRKRRSRPMPKWLKKKGELDEIAQRRTLMFLDVLSGATPVTDAIEQAQISRATYYKLEEQALKAILVAMEPGAVPGRAPEISTRLWQVEARVKELEMDKRRLQKLLSMTRKVLRPGTMKAAPGRPRSAKAGRSDSVLSKTSREPGQPISSSEPPIR